MLRRISTITATAIALGTSFAGPANANQDLRSPDNRTSPSPTAAQDLRSPDAVDASRAALDGLQPQDLRSPDAVDGGQRVGVYALDSTTPVSGSEPHAGGFDWGDAVIGAGGLLGLLSLAAGTLMINAHIRRRRRFAG